MPPLSLLGQPPSVGQKHLNDSPITTRRRRKREGESTLCITSTHCLRKVSSGAPRAARSNPNASSQSFIWNEIRWPPALLEKKQQQQQSRVFSALFCMFTLTWTTEKELERVFENKGDEFRREKNMEIQSDGEKIGNASGQQGVANKVKMSGSEK